MGEQFLSKQAHGFRTRHNEAYERMKIPTLISRSKTNIMTRELRCEASAAAGQLDHGAEVMLRGRGDHVAVLLAGREVGTIDSAEARTLGEALKVGCGVLRASVTAHSSVSPTFTVRLSEVP